MAAGFDVRKHRNPDLQGTDPANICNRGTAGMGVQLELSKSVRRAMFASLSREGRKSTTARFHAFVDAIRGVLATAPTDAVWPGCRGARAAMD